MIFPILFIFFSGTRAFNYTSINLPYEHLQYYFTNFPELYEQCKDDPECPFKENSVPNRCWGYEYNCNPNNQYSTPTCPGEFNGWVKTKQEQLKMFYNQADFGYIKQQLQEMKVICEPLFPHDSSLECSDHLRFCRGRNIWMNFTSLWKRGEPVRYTMDILGENDIGGYCNIHSQRLKDQLDHVSPLQSWGPEIQYFRQLHHRPIIENDCDVIIEKPTFIMKIDATGNMYHHFCDFFNLYASLHINSTAPNAFTTDVHILIWETFTYHSAFQETWKAFTTHPIWNLKRFRGKTVCFRNAVFPLLPRMIFGLYYNTPIIDGCENSGLFRAFSQHILHRLKIPIWKRADRKIRITLLSRDTKYRRILNEDELIEGLAENEGYSVQRVVYNRDISFRKQLELTRNSDMLIGIHGAGLTHLMFLPDWAAVFELYNCEDPSCYMDLTRLRGLKYTTWEAQDKLFQQDQGKHPDGRAHAKFTNYSFDKDEFLRLVALSTEYIRKHPKFLEYLRGIGDEMEMEGNDYIDEDSSEPDKVNMHEGKLKEEEMKIDQNKDKIDPNEETNSNEAMCKVPQTDRYRYAQNFNEKSMSIDQTDNEIVHDEL